MAGDNQEVKYSATLDVSKFVSNSQKAAQAAQSIGKASSSSAPSKALDAHSSSVAKLADKYRMLERSRSFFDKEPGQLKQIDTQQQRILKNLTNMAKTEQEYAKYAKLSAQYTQGGTFSPHSQRQSGQLKGIALQLAGQGVMQAGAYGRQLYGSGISAYQSLNSQYSIDPNLTAANRNLTRSKLGLGSQLSGYEAFKTNLQAGVNSSPLAAPLAIGGDVLGAAAPAAGGIMQMLGALKTVNPKAAESIGEMALKFGALLGKGGVLGGAAAAGGMAGMWLGNTLNKAINPNAKEQGWGDVLDTVKKTVALDVGAVTGMNKNVVGGVGSILGVTPNNHSDVGSVWADMWGDKKGAASIRQGNETKDTTKAAAEAIAKIATSANEFKKVIASPQFQIAAAGIRNQISDFNYSSAKDERLAKRGFARQKEDIGTSRSRVNEDYAIQQQKFGIQAARMDEDFARNKKRTEEDYTRTVQKNELSVSRIRRDAVVNATRQNEDFTRSRLRQTQDVTRQTQRLEQDTARNTLRLTEDTNRERLRSDQDYTRNLTVMNRDQARSSQDLNRNFKDSLLSIVAPGLASSKGYQIAKLMRDYKRESGRLNEDQAQSRSDLERDRNRNLEDVNRGASRGFEDITREGGRGREDIQRANERFGEDTAREQSRASMDLQKQTVDALTDSMIAAKEAEIQHTRSIQDIDREYARGKQDLALAEADATREHTRALQDLAKEEKRASEDLKETMDEIRHSREIFARDMNLQLTQMGLDLADKTGSAKNYTADDITNAANLGGVNTNNPSDKTGGSAIDRLKDQISGMVPHFATGTAFVQKTGLFHLDRGEAVIPAALNQALHGKLGIPGVAATGGATGGGGSSGAMDMAGMSASAQAAYAALMKGVPIAGMDNQPKTDYLHPFGNTGPNINSGVGGSGGGDSTAQYLAMRGIGIGGGALGSSAGGAYAALPGTSNGIGGGGNFFSPHIRPGWAGRGFQSGWNNGKVNMGGAPGGYGFANGGGYGYQPPMSGGGGSGINLNIHVNNNGEQRTIKGAEDKLKSFVGGLFNGTNAGVY